MAKRLGKRILYTKFDVEAKRVKPFFRKACTEGLYTGWNVTIPHKETLLSLVNSVSTEAKVIGAINVVHFTKKNAIGYNTDVIGILSTFKEQRLALGGRSVLMFGAGGAAKAVAFALAKSGAKTVWVGNRTPKAAKSLCRQFAKLFPETQFRFIGDVLQITEEISCVINATPVGLKGFRGTFLFPLHMTKNAMAFDLIYRPLETTFLKLAEKRALRTVNGLDMFLWQAMATWEIWFGRIATPKLVKRQLKKELLKCM